ncbi:MAG: hypothetical protein JWO57_2503, partial [Pseudonocardiales bacterium]|nr:hypothetical protein [Pseudonocardiales bacterium]
MHRTRRSRRMTVTATLAAAVFTAALVPALGTAPA